MGGKSGKGGKAVGGPGSKTSSSKKVSACTARPHGPREHRPFPTPPPHRALFRALFR